MSDLPVPRVDLQFRLPEAGRIRLGEKGGPGGMRTIDTFRFTSQHQDALQQVADLYGGTVVPWRDRSVTSGQFELRTSAAEIEIALPQDCYSEWFELWLQGGIQRRCDARTCAKTQSGPDGPEIVDVPCICRAQGKRECKLKIRLSVLLPDVRFAGTWRLETSSKVARVSLPPMIALLQMHGGLQRGILSIEKHQEMRLGKKKIFQVPKLSSQHTLNEMAAGEARLGALPEGRPSVEALALEAPQWSEAWDPDDAIADAEVVEETSFDVITGEHPIDEALCKKYLEDMTLHRRNKAVIRARELALDMGEPMPGKWQEISPRLVDALMKEGA